MSSTRAAPTEPIRRPSKSPAPPAKDYFRGDIEGLRAVAVVAVIGFHAYVPGFGGGFVGVDIFFVISGFLITQLMIRESERSGHLDLRAFYGRRVRRLLPLATVVIVATLVGSAIFASPIYQEQFGADGRASALFFSNIRFSRLATDYFSQGGPESPFQHFWSLSLEEQWYILWPAVFGSTLLLARRTGRQAGSALRSVLAVLLLVSLTACILVTPNDQPIAFFHLGTRAWELVAGGLLAALSTRLPSLPSRAGLAISITGLLMVVWSITQFSSATEFPGVAAMLPVAGTVLIILAGVASPATGLGVALGALPMRMIGRYSYALYLWHWPVLVLPTEVRDSSLNWKRALVLVVVVVVPLAVASYHLVETPFRRSEWLRASHARSLGFGLALVSVSVVASIVYGAVVTSGDLHAGRPSEPGPIGLGADLRITEFVPSNLVPPLRGRDDTAPDRGDCPELGRCSLGPSGVDPHVVVYGDSHSSHWDAGLAPAAAATATQVTRFTAGACGSFLYPPILPRDDCGAWRRDSLDEIRSLEPDGIVLTNHSLPAYDRDEQEWETGVRDAIRSYRTIAPVTVMAQTPASEEEVPSCLAVHLESSRACEPSWPNALNERLQTITEEEGAQFIDTRLWFCTETRCPVIAGNTLVLRDRHHVTAAFARERTAQLEEVLLQAAPR